jgi:hypothetical protein
MGTYFESGLGKAFLGTDVDMGRNAASEALSGLSHFSPSLAMVFVSSERDISEVTRGVHNVLGDCPVIGTSTAGKIANTLVTNFPLDELVMVAYLCGVSTGFSVGVTKPPLPDKGQRRLFSWNGHFSSHASAQPGWHVWGSKGGDTCPYGAFYGKSLQS